MFLIVAPTTDPTSVHTDETTLNTAQEDSTVANGNTNDATEKDYANANNDGTADKGESITVQTQPLRGLFATLSEPICYCNQFVEITEPILERFIYFNESCIVVVIDSALTLALDVSLP